MNILFLHRSGKFMFLRTIKKCLSSSSGIFSQDTQRWICSTRFEDRWHKAVSKLKKLKIESSSCRCTMTWVGRKVKKTSRSVFRTQRQSRLTCTMWRRCWSMPRAHATPRRGLSSSGWIRGHTKIGPVREVRVTNHLEQDGIESQVKSFKNDGAVSWIAIFRETMM